MDASISALARAVKFLRLGPRSNVSDLPAEELSQPVQAEAVRIEDIFHSKLNKCNAEALPELRRLRAETAPIVCYESDDEGSGNETAASPPTLTLGTESFTSEVADSTNLPQNDAAIQARMDALSVQQNLLGSGHPDVQFLANHIRQHRCRRLTSMTNGGGGF